MAHSVMIIGAGLIGASIGCALTREGWRVHLEDKDPHHAVVAASRGAGRVEPIRPGDVDLVVVSIPPDAIPEVVASSLHRFPRAVITDVGSVKGQVLDRIEAMGVEVSRYCGSHPMAGSQFSGPITANPDLFVNRTWVVSPGADTSDLAFEMVQNLAKACQARVVNLDAHTHDRAVAQVSHVPQIMSSLVAAHLRSVPHQNLLLAGQGVRDVTRIAGSDPKLWRQIISANRDAIRAELAAIRDDFDWLLTRLDDPEAVEVFLADGQRGHDALPGKHGQDRRLWRTVIVAIPDEPGALAGLFADIENAGVNIEDLSIEHDQLAQAGFLSILVEPDKADSLRDQLSSLGWSLRA